MPAHIGSVVVVVERHRQAGVGTVWRGKGGKKTLALNGGVCAACSSNADRANADMGNRRSSAWYGNIW